MNVFWVESQSWPVKEEVGMSSDGSPGGKALDHRHTILGKALDRSHTILDN